MEDQTKLPRRTLLVLGGAAAASFATGCAILRGGASHPTFSPLPSAVVDRTVKIPLAELNKLEKGASLLVKLPDPGGELLVAQLEDGTYRASSAECTHWGCTVDFAPDVKEWQCPCHGSRFALDGKVLEGPADDPLPQAETRLDGDHLIVSYSGV